ncbi:MAG: hypothetical protein U0168_10440 [Nannocystaceae bacterium]
MIVWDRGVAPRTSRWTRAAALLKLLFELHGHRELLVCGRWCAPP